MIKYIQSNSFKMALSATIAVLIANELGLQFGVTAGIIAILSIQNTKKEALLVGGRRTIAAIIAILLSFVLYIVLGNNPLIFGLFLIIFIPTTKKLKIEEGMVVGSVLSTHLLTSSNINFTWIVNEVSLTFIGIGVALIFNLYTSSLDKSFNKNKEDIEEKYRVILSDMAESLITQAVPIYEQKILVEVENLIKETRIMALQINNNYLFKNENYYIKYAEMRGMQLEIIKRMKDHFSRFYKKFEQTELLSELTLNVAVNIHADNDCVELIEKLSDLRDHYKKMELPKSREEFENRALLFQFLNDLEDFLNTKREFYIKMYKK